MCTVTVVPGGRGSSGAVAPTLRVVFNRDELRTRPRSIPPALHACGDRRTIMPVDPWSGGTWIGANDAGLVVGLLNVNAEPTEPAATPSEPPPESRGVIVPGLLAAGSLTGLLHASHSIDASRHAPFRIMATDGREFVLLASQGHDLREVLRERFLRPVMLTSSGLGDQLVESPRRALFDEVFARWGDWLDAQRRFHEHTWAGRGHISVLMSRADARTESRVVIDLYADRVSMEYVPLLDRADSASCAVPVSLPLTLSPAAA